MSKESDIFRITLLTQNRQKYFESEAPANNPDKVRELILVAKSKGVNLKKTESREQDIEWF